MKLIGLIGGMSWESTATYYRELNEIVKRELGGLNSARCLLYSVNFAEIEKMQVQGDWAGAASILKEAARSLEAAGADFLLICTNTMHIVASDVAASVTIPIVHIADATADALVADGIETVGFIGTRFSMEQAFYRGRLEEKGLRVIIPEMQERETIHQVIYSELCLGEIKPSSRERYLDILASLSNRGAQAVILGCTEIGLLVRQEDTPVPLYDTTRLHAEKAVQLALAECSGSGHPGAGHPGSGHPGAERPEPGVGG